MTLTTDQFELHEEETQSAADLSFGGDKFCHSDVMISSVLEMQVFSSAWLHFTKCGENAICSYNSCFPAVAFQKLKMD